MTTSTRQNATKASAVNPIVTELSRDLNGFETLLDIAREALRLSPPRYVSSIFGSPETWLPPQRRFSEYNIGNPWRLVKLARYLLDVTLPALASTPPDLARTLFPPVVNRRFWRPTTFYRQPDRFAGVASFPAEHWFFVNGVATNEDVARFNSALLAHMFHRPVTVIQNATDSLPLDLYECAIGKEFRVHPDYPDMRTFTEPAWWATMAILEAINAADTRKVVVIAHSQGTIIMANVLRALAGALHAEAPTTREDWQVCAQQLTGTPTTQQHEILCSDLADALHVFAASEAERPGQCLEKLEIYTFANCADRMTYVAGRPNLPYLEHFANERDIVARLGILSPLRGQNDGPIEIDGPLFEQKRAWGHLLNEHYLTAMFDYRSGRGQGGEGPFVFQGDGMARPRLYGYCFGETPGPVRRRPVAARRGERVA